MICLRLSNEFPAPGFSWTVTDSNYEPGYFIADGKTMEEAIRNYSGHLEEEGGASERIEIEGPAIDLKRKKFYTSK